MILERLAKNANLLLDRIERTRERDLVVFHNRGPESRRAAGKTGHVATARAEGGSLDACVAQRERKRSGQHVRKMAPPCHLLVMCGRVEHFDAGA